MTKDNKQDVLISCLGNIRGCKVNHCDVAGICHQTTVLKEKANGVFKTTED
jgi:hypothetical protein